MPLLGQHDHPWTDRTKRPHGDLQWHSVTPLCHAYLPPSHSTTQLVVWCVPWAVMTVCVLPPIPYCVKEKEPCHHVPGVSDKGRHPLPTIPFTFLNKPFPHILKLPHSLLFSPNESARAARARAFCVPAADARAVVSYPVDFATACILHFACLCTCGFSARRCLRCTALHLHAFLRRLLCAHCIPLRHTAHGFACARLPFLHALLPAALFAAPFWWRFYAALCAARHYVCRIIIIWDLAWLAF